MSETPGQDTGSSDQGMSLEDVAELGPLPGVVADDAAEERGEDESATGDNKGRGFLGALFSRGPATETRD